MITNISLILAVLALAAAVCFHPFVRSQPLAINITWVVGTASVAALLVYYTFWIDLSKAVLSPIVIASVAKQPPNTVVGGVTWDDRFSELRIVLGNPTKWDYQNVDVRIIPDKPVVAAEASSDVSTVSLARLGPPIQTLEIGFPDGSRRRVDLIVLASGHGYRLRAEVLPAQSHISIRMAIADMAGFAKVKPPTPPPNFGVEDADYVMRQEADSGRSIWWGHSVRPSTVFERATATRVEIAGAFMVSDAKKKVTLDVPVVRH